MFSVCSAKRAAPKKRKRVCSRTDISLENTDNIFPYVTWISLNMPVICRSERGRSYFDYEFLRHIVSPQLVHCCEREFRAAVFCRETRFVSQRSLYTLRTIFRPFICSKDAHTIRVRTIRDTRFFALQERETRDGVEKCFCFLRASRVAVT